MKVIKKLILLILLIGLIVLTFAFGYYLAVTKDAVLSTEKLHLEKSSLQVYDAYGMPIELASFVPIKQTMGIEDIPEHTKLAFVNVEDKRFYSHNGFDVKRIAKAAWNNLKSRSFKEGASTISQQLIKNTHLTQEKTIKRKLQEWKLTRTLEQRYSKDEILEKYLNSIYFGHNCFGIQSAAEFYFGKTTQQLNLSDSAILAGLVKSPNRYSPFKDPESCRKRKAIVLHTMLLNGSITQAEKEAALNEPLPQNAGRSKKNQGYLAFVFDELSTIIEERQFTLTENIEIFTGLEPDLQAKMEELTQEDLGCDKTILSMNCITGNFNACVSTVGNIRRLPGSLIKPLLVYAPAVEEDLLSPVTPILDEAVNYNGYTPENYDGVYHGYQSVRECVSKSLNVPAVKVLQALSIKKGVHYLEKLGLSIDRDDHSLALALGGMKKGFTLRDVMGGYLTLQNRGISRDFGFISEIRLNEKTIYTRPKMKNRVFSEATAYLMTDMLKDTAQTGTAKKLRTLPFDVAAKTGTVGTKNGNTDAYALAYTSENMIAAWLGNADYTPISHTGGGLPCNYLHALYEYLRIKNNDFPDFVRPTSVCSQTIDTIAYYDTHTILRADENAPAEYYFEELFKQNALPTKKSDFFSHPSISLPKISLENNQVFIVLDKSAPNIYTYLIERYDYVTHTTLYNGSLLPVFIDDTLEENKDYIYTVTPIFNDRRGKTVSLPVVSTKPRPNESERELLDKSWWTY